MVIVFFDQAMPDKLTYRRSYAITQGAAEVGPRRPYGFRQLIQRSFGPVAKRPQELLLERRFPHAGMLGASM
jgi:hypothetical protein